MNTGRVVFVLLVVALCATPALAHVPGFASDNTSPETAVMVPDASKSWSFYDRLGPEEARYYRVTVEAGERLLVGTFTPEAGAFTPSLVLMSESIEGREAVPSQVTVPDGMGAVVLIGERPERASYEPFAPSANYHTVDVERPVESQETYLLVVYEPAGRTGPVGVAVGYEERFSPVEYLRVPFDLVRTHLWEGQHPVLVFAPWLVTGLVGVAALRRRPTQAPPIVRYGLGVAALAVLGTAASAAIQTVLALAETGPTASALVTAAFVLVPALAGGWVFTIARREQPELRPATRAGLVLAGAASLAAWAGFVVAPLLFVGFAAMPSAWVAD